MRQSLIVLAAVLLAAPLLAQGQSASGRPGCLAEVQAAETRHHLPPGLLLSMALVESGRRDALAGLTAPWPFTIQADGQGHFYDTIEDAVHDAAKLLAAGNAFVDVGCLQVDLFHHPKAFKTLRDAFDPAANVDYAARYLESLARSHGSWLTAIAAYNAGDPADGVGYLARVLYLWKGVRVSPAALRAAPDNPERTGFLLDAPPQPLDLAQRFYADKDFASALAIYDETLRHEPRNVTAMLGAAETLAAAERTAEARARFEQALKTAPDNRLALEGMIRMTAHLPAAERLAAYTAARAVAPGSPELISRIALLQADAGHLSDAAATMGEAVQLAPEDLLMKLDFALLLDRAGRLGAALEAYQTFLSLYQPGHSPGLNIPLQAVQARAAWLLSHPS